MNWSDIPLILLTLAGAFVFFGITVFVHELGHFLAARRMGLVVERFAIGFGPKIWGKTLQGVEYCINWIPFGGFVQLPQMAPMEMVEGKTEQKAEDLPPVTPWAKIVTAFAGPLFSFLLAIVFACLVWLVGMPENQLLKTTRIGYIDPDSPAAKAGLLPGDQILSINGMPVTRWQGTYNGVNEAIRLSTTRQVEVKALRDGEEYLFKMETVPDAEWENLAKVGFEDYHYQKMIVQEVLKGSPAERAGIRSGDEVVSVAGEPVYSPVHVIKLLEKQEGPVHLHVLRQGQPLDFEIVPEMELSSKRKLLGLVWKIDFREVVHPLPQTQIANSALLISKTLGALFSPGSRVKAQHLGGPLMIFDRIMLLLKTDVRLLMYFCVFLNVNLAILNLLPLPILDGGHILLSLVEAVRRRPMEVKVLYALQTSFFVLLMMFFLFVSYHDVGRIWKSSQESRRAEEEARTREPIRFEGQPQEPAKP
jgi:regulator of sigma E protease